MTDVTKLLLGWLVMGLEHAAFSLGMNGVDFRGVLRSRLKLP